MVELMVYFYPKPLQHSWDSTGYHIDGGVMVITGSAGITPIYVEGGYCVTVDGSTGAYEPVIELASDDKIDIVEGVVDYG